LVRFGYDGTAFHGWARQPDLRTVEGEILRGLVRYRIVPSAGDAELRVASRTDRGVSARGNVLALVAKLEGAHLLRALNGLSSEIFFSAATEISSEFRVRGATRRIYRYFEPTAVRDPARWEEAAELFLGRVDVRSLGRGLPAGTPQWRTVESVRVSPSPGGLLLEVRAPSFVWGMVRKIVGALREVDSGRLTPSRLSRALAGRERLSLPLAEPEPLVLWEVEFPLSWQHVWSGPNRHQTRKWATALANSRTRQHVLEAVAADWIRPAP
jgi:tRNA pseudouridine38-40 synthase